MNKNKDSIILGIESSCDDTSAAVIHNGTLLSNVTASQAIHKEYGGVVPELASRAHQENIIPVVDSALKTAGISVENLTAIAFTKGPGLLGSLLVGTSFAKSLGLALDIPLLDVHHMKAHIHAHFIKEKNTTKKVPEFPFICLTVSGGHTQIVKVKDYLDFELLGTTLDDAIGEAFDKCGKVLGLGYPAGPAIDRKAKLGNPKAFDFPIPKAFNLDLSFSGFKTAVINYIHKNTQKDKRFIEENII